MTGQTAAEVAVLIGSGSIGQAIARRVGVGRTILIADIDEAKARAAAEVLEGAGYAVRTAQVDVASHASVRELAAVAQRLGTVLRVIHTAGLSPAQATPAAIVAVDLLGAAFVLEEFGSVIGAGGSAVVIASQAGHMLPPLEAEQVVALGSTPSDDLAALPMLQPDAVPGSGHAYALAKRANAIRVQAESVRWGDRGARLNSISPGIIMTPLALDEFRGPGGEGYRRMVDASASGRVGTSDEVAGLAAFLMGPDGAFITGTDVLIDGGVMAAIATGRYEVRLS